MKRKERFSTVAVGGRYDNLIAHYELPTKDSGNLMGVGARIFISKIIPIMKSQKPRDREVLVCSKSNDQRLLVKTLKSCQMKGLSSELSWKVFMDQNQPAKECKDKGI